MQDIHRHLGACLVGTFAVCLLATTGAAADLVVAVDNIKENNGVLRVAVYEAANWLDEDDGKLAAGKAVDLTEREGDEPVVMNFELEPGEYGAVVYHDVNANRVLDKNLIGIPKEPYAFSLGFDKLRRPTFEECKFTVDEDGAAITLTLKD